MEERFLNEVLLGCPQLKAWVLRPEVPDELLGEPKLPVCEVAPR
jgi:hypothetical protein